MQGMNVKKNDVINGYMRLKYAPFFRPVTYQ